MLVYLTDNHIHPHVQYKYNRIQQDQPPPAIGCCSTPTGGAGSRGAMEPDRGSQLGTFPGLFVPHPHDDLSPCLALFQKVQAFCYPLEREDLCVDDGFRATRCK